jgi:hypothetical protein
MEHNVRARVLNVVKALNVLEQILIAMIKEAYAKEIIQNVKMTQRAAGARQYIPDQKKHATEQFRLVLLLVQYVPMEVRVRVLNQSVPEKERCVQEMKRNVLAARCVKAQRRFAPVRERFAEERVLNAQAAHCVPALSQCVQGMKRVVPEGILYAQIAQIAILKIRQ